MKELFEKFFEIVDQAKGVKEKMQEELKKYAEINKKALTEASDKIKSQMEQAMKKVTDPNNLQEIMKAVQEVTTTFIGAENVKKLMEIQQKYPFLSDFMKTLIPQNKR